jgi:hypothetical protein
MEIIMSGVMAANSEMILELLLKRLAHRLWPNASSRTKETARNTESFIVTDTAFFALSTFPAPISFDTRVLHKQHMLVHRHTPCVK